MKLLSNVLAIGGGVQPSHARLRLAKEGLAKSQLEVTETAAKLERLQSVIDGADQAARAASAAQSAAKDFRTTWAREGCRYSDTQELQRLEAQAMEASEDAKRATVHADTVRLEFRRLQSALESRHVDVNGARNEITAAVGVVFAEESAELLARFEAAAADYRRLREQVMALYFGIERPWSLDTKNSRDPCHESIAIIDAALQRGKIEPWNKFVESMRDVRSYLAELTAPVRARIEELRK
jgi:hypothetical protein